MVQGIPQGGWQGPGLRAPLVGTREGAQTASVGLPLAAVTGVAVPSFPFLFVDPLQLGGGGGSQGLSAWKS